MKQEFITTYGKVVIERDKIFIFEEDPGSIAREIYFFVFIALQLAGRVFNVPEMKWISLVFGLLGTIYSILPFFKHKNQSSKSRILIKKITNISNEDDKDGINTLVKLYLSSGKIRYIKFRKLENQYQPFIEAVSQQLLLPQTTV
jgi:hypothetical protein